MLYWVYSARKEFTIDFRFIVVEYNAMMNTIRRGESSNVVPTKSSQNTPHTTPLRASYGVSAKESREHIGIYVFHCRVLVVSLVIC